MTNLEWIRTLSAEELADWFYDEWLHHLQYRWSSSRGGLIIWLKDRKTENSSEIPNNCEDLQDWKDRMWAEAFKDEPQTYSKGLQLFADILFDKEKSEQFLKECKALGIEPQTEGEGE